VDNRQVCYMAGGEKPVMRASVLALVVAAASLAASPCAARHKDITPDQVAAFRPGVATYQDVVGALGRPQTEMLDSDGTRTIQYGAIRAHAKAASYIPVVGLFAGGAIGTSSAVAFTFGPDGLLKRYTTQTTRIDCGAAIAGMNCKGASVPNPASQEAAQPIQAAKASSQPRLAAGAPAAYVAKPVPAPAAKPAPRPASRARPACGGLRSETNPDAVTCP
jgi:hypothetical protein